MPSLAALLLGALPGVLPGTTSGVDLSLAERFPAAEVAPGAVLPWPGDADGLFRLERFAFERSGQRFEAGPSTLLVGAGALGPVWAALVPDDPGTIAGDLPGAGEPLAHCYLRFHPAELEALFPPASVRASDERWRLPAGHRLVLAKLRSSWQADGRPVAPPPGTVVLDCGTAESAAEPGPGRRRFYMAEADGPLRYHDAFEGQALPRDVAVAPAAARAALEEAWSAFDAEYAMFGLREVDWDARRALFAGWSAEVDTAWELALAVERLVAPLDDRHTTVGVGDELLVRDLAPPDHRANFRAVMARLGPMTQPRRGINWGRTADGIGYVSISALDRDDLVGHFDRALEELSDVRALVVDLRFNTGGDERIAQALAGRFVDEPVVYAEHRFRAGPGHDDLGPWFERVLEPRAPRWERPTHVLIGPAVMSSAEAFALMFRAAPGCELVGVRTAGSSGNPRLLPLAAGVTARVPRWLAALPDGTPLEGRGVEPDRSFPAPADPDRDPILDPLLESLR